jgi:gluconolactonase
MGDMTSDPDVRVIASGLRFPEGPIVAPDGSVWVTEIERGTVTRVDVATGATEVVVETGGGPNGLAVGPDGAVYICNNGGYFTFAESNGLNVPSHGAPGWTGGSIQRFDPVTGELDTLYDRCGDVRLGAPNDLVFDAHDGFWFTDHAVDADHLSDRAGIYYALADGSELRPVVHGTETANGVGLSPRGDRLYVAETYPGKVWAWAVPAPGEVAPLPGGDPDDHTGGVLLYDAPEGDLFDSLAVDGEGWVCVATIMRGGVTGVAPDGSATEHFPLADPIVTNVCFAARTPAGEPDPERRTAYVTASGTGQLLAVRWPRRGLRLAH